MQYSPQPASFSAQGEGWRSKKEMDEIAASQFAAERSSRTRTQSGFLFFDVGGIGSPLQGANIDVTGMTDAKGNELMYFEIPVDNYLNAPENP